MAMLASCNNVRRNPGRVYMPDMAYSRAYETYSSTEGLQKEGAHYTSMPVVGTIARGDMLQIYSLANDSAGYAQSASVKNPLKIDSIDKKEAERLYLVNCAVCHGAKLDGNGPLYKDGNGPYPSKPATLVGDAKYEAMAEGTIFHAITYGKNAMGSYASQLNTYQRWMVVAYIKSKQGAKMAAGATADSTKGKMPAMDTAAKKTVKM
jgi:mono/diheme cytochrome c family protein